MKRQPCSECPWRKDVPVGQFPPERYRSLASTAYDASMVQFACHKSIEGRELVCAGFLVANSNHNLGVRLAVIRGDTDLTKVASDAPLYSSYRAMAVANGVAPDDPVLQPCRANRDDVAAGKWRKSR